MNCFYALFLISIGIVSTFFFIRRIRVKNRLRDTGIDVLATVTDRVETTGRYATVYIHYQFLTSEGWRVNGVSESNPRHILTVGDQVPVIYDVDDSSNHSLKNDVGTDKNIFFIVLLWLGVLLILIKIWR